MALATSAIAQGAHEELIARHAAANDVPEALVRRIITIESRGNPGLVNQGNYGLMQIRLGTARAMGYDGSPQGLLDADTNMTYAVKYLAGAYRAAGCDHDLTVAYYQHGYVRAGKARCGPQTPFAVAQAETKSAKLPAAKGVQETALPQSASKSPPVQEAASSADVLKPKVVHTIPVSGRDSGGATSPTTRPAAGDAAPSNPAPQSVTFADRMMVALPATTGAREKVKPEAIPPAQAGKSDLLSAQKKESKSARPRVRKHASSTRQRHADKADASVNVISFLKNLVTPEKKRPGRKRKAEALQAER
jgi:hypothetical protein